MFETMTYTEIMTAYEELFEKMEKIDKMLNTINLKTAKTISEDELEFIEATEECFTEEDEFGAVSHIYFLNENEKALMDYIKVRNMPMVLKIQVNATVLYFSDRVSPESVKTKFEEVFEITEEDFYDEEAYQYIFTA